MAAIKPHLALDNEVTELESRYWDCSRPPTELQGLGRDVDEAAAQCPSPFKVIDASHAELLTLAYTRKIIVEQLAGRTLTPRFKEDGELALFIDKPITGPTWNPMLQVSSTRMLSWTTKMGTPSFSLPAGASEVGGSCPGATAGQSLVGKDLRERAAKTLLPVLERPGEKLRLNLAKTICGSCYATGGQYGTASVQFHEMVRYAWARKAINEDMSGQRLDINAEREQSAFTQIMIEAINNTDFDMSKEGAHWKGQRFFRIHDSGDFFSIPYLRGWKAVAEYFHPSRHKDPIIFWAPSRIWALGRNVVELVNRINGNGDSNLIIRPSAYHVNQHGPENLGPGWAACSTTYDYDGKEGAEGSSYDWDCKAYESAKGPSCRGAKDPEGRVGCRVCWKHTEMRVNYTLH